MARGDRVSVASSRRRAGVETRPQDTNTGKVTASSLQNPAFRKIHGFTSCQKCFIRAVRVQLVLTKMRRISWRWEAVRDLSKNFSSFLFGLQRVAISINMKALGLWVAR